MAKLELPDYSSKETMAKVKLQSSAGKQCKKQATGRKLFHSTTAAPTEDEKVHQNSVFTPYTSPYFN
jgi:hypothetical protein